ncbi:---NA--- [Paramuricea clavata]|uniref:---NA n=1 Tax=Paramuricea clavata TaxID=317549 RepID=A0A7D9D7H1_PARCT|nr:---NA--- [Paramuricea clavata]
MKFFEVISVLWCCVVTNAESLKENARIIRPSSIAVADTMNAFKTLVFNSRRNFVKSPSSVKETSMTVTPTTMQFKKHIELAEDGGPTLALILGCVFAAVMILFVVGLLVVLCKYKKGKNKSYGYQYQRIGDDDPHLAEKATKPVIAKSMFTTPSKCLGLVKKIITADGGVIAIEDIILKIGPGCLAKDTEITLRNSDKDIAIKSLLDLGLVVAAPRVVEFLPDGLKFLKPADLTITFQNTVSNTELFVLHGSYNPVHQRIVWELVTNGTEERNVERVCNTKINSFCFKMFILATRGKLARILSHLNHSFTCRAYAFYRRLPTLDTIDISVVMLSEFVDKNEEEDIEQLKDHLKAGYVKGEKGMLKRIYTDRRLEMSLHFPGVENTSFSFIVDQPQLDSVGFVIDHFKKIAITSPASGEVKISEVRRGRKCKDENEPLWRMNIRETQEKIGVEVAEVQYSASNPQPEVVYRTTKLTKEEITQMSPIVGVDWDSLAGLMDIPYSEREEIRVDYGNLLSISSKAKKVFELFNDSTAFDRHILVKYFKELGRHDLEKEMLPVEDQNGSEEVETPPSLPETTGEDLPHTPLSPREMSRLGRRIVVEWDRLAGLMDIPKAKRDDIRYSLIYNDSRSRAEKILAIFNNKEGFSREKLARCLKEIQQLDLIKPVTTGEWRNL